MLVSNGLVQGGAETQTVRLAQALNLRGDKVAILSLLPARAFAATMRDAGVELFQVRLPTRLRGIGAIASGIGLIRAWRPDVLVSFVYQANVLGRLAGRVARVPVVVSSVRNERIGGRAREAVLRLTDAMADVTTTNSAVAAQSLLRRHVVTAGRLRIVPNGLDADTMTRAPAVRRATRLSLGLPAADTFLWMAAGRLEAQKDFLGLVEAFSHLPDHARLVIAGQGPELRSLAERIRALGLQERAVLLGVREDIPELLAAADALVLSSGWEGLPNIVMEAMASAKPVVATRVGGVPELVQHGVTGLLVDPGKPSHLAAAMLQMMAMSSDERARLGAAGRLRVQGQWSLERMKTAWFDVLDEALMRRPKGPAARLARAAPP